MLYRIKSCFIGKVLFEKDCDSLKLCVEAAVEARANLTRAYLTDAYLARANLAGACLADANLAGACLADAYLAGAYLPRANLADANLAGAYLPRANLADANLAGAYLAGANLTDAYLAGAYLPRANLADANLARAYLAGANLAGANLAGANLARAYLAGATYGKDIPLTCTPIFISGLRYPVLVLDRHMKIGCELRSIAEWREMEDAKIQALDGDNGLAAWRANKNWLLACAEYHARGCEKGAAEDAA